MLLSTSLKLPAAVCLLTFFLVGCAAPPAADNAALPTPSVEPAKFPFSVAEPDTFQAEIVVSGEGFERKIFVARDHGRYRVDYDTDSVDARGVIRADKNYLISYKDRLYAEELTNGGVLPDPDEFAGPLLGRRMHVAFQRLGTEDGLEKYETRFDDSDAAIAIVYFNPALKMVVKQQLYSVAEGERRLVSSTQLRNVKLEAPSELFEPPAGFRSVTMEEFRRRLRP